MILLVEALGTELIGSAPNGNQPNLPARRTIGAKAGPVSPRTVQESVFHKRSLSLRPEVTLLS